jgi:hyperosmotically inducible protein
MAVAPSDVGRIAMKTFRLMIIAALVLVFGLTSACQTLTGRSTGRYIDDKTITAKVKSKLAAEKAANLTRIGVSTVNGVVMLNGVADSSQEKARAEELATNVEGVKQVQNNVQVRAPAASPR